MKEKLISNWGLKLVSVLFAMVLWLFVVNIDDPVMTKKFKNIPVKILSENLLEEAGEMYEVLDGSDSVSVTLKAKRSVVESLSTSDFSATADFAERISENSIPIKVQVTKRQNEILDISMQNNTVKIKVEKRAQKAVPVELKIEGKTADGYTVGSADATDTITIEGPESVVSKVARIVVPVNINGASEDIEITAGGAYYAEDGTVIEDKKIKGDVSKIEVKIHLLHTKSIDLNLSTEGEPASEYRCQDIQYAPTTITIAGEPEALAKINTLQIPSTELSITGANATITKEIDITKYLPDNVILCDEKDRKIKVTLVISALDGKEFKIPMSAVGILNTPSGMDVSLDNSKTVSVIVKGSSEELNSLTRDEIKVSVDVKDRAVGTYNLQAEVTVPSGYVVMNKPMVSVTITQAGDTTPNEVVVTPQPEIPANTTVQTYSPQPTQPGHVTQPSQVPAVESPTPVPTAEPSAAPVDEEE